MSEEVCFSCRRLKPGFHCDLCQNRVCKSCVEYLDEGTFSFLEVIPKELSHTRYCTSCYDLQVSPALETYNETIERAKGLFIFFVTQKKAIPLLKRSKEKIQISQCKDRDETILRLAFLAAQRGFNSVIEVEVTATKIRNAGYQKSSWSGSGYPAEINADKMKHFE
jgi:hypothetical protein